MDIDLEDVMWRASVDGDEVDVSGPEAQALIARLKSAEAKVLAVWEMVDAMSEAVAWDRLTTPQGEAEYPVSYLLEQLEKAIDI